MQEDTRENLLSLSRLANLADELGYPSTLPDIGAYYNAREKVVSKVIDNNAFSGRYYLSNGEYRNRINTEARAKIHVFCPPLMQYIKFALALAFRDHGLKTCEFQVVIHPDDRLLDGGLYSVEERRISMLQLNDFVRSNAD